MPKRVWRHDKLTSNMSTEDVLMCYKHLVKGVFKLVDVRPQEYEDCFKGCADKWFDTGIVRGKI